MARNPQPPQDMSLTPDEMRAGVTRFKRRLAEIEQFDPQAMTSRRDPRIDTLEPAIAGSLADTFREGTQAYKRYAQAKKIDTATFGNLPPMPGVFYRISWSCQGIASGGPPVPPRAVSARIFKLKL
jgi:hypothetical protein